MNILIVDDEPEVLRSFERVFKRRANFNVSVTTSGIASIELIKNNKYDIVLLDLIIPDLDGINILERTKPFCPNTEFIMVTAVDDIENVVKAIRLGAFDYLVKPVEVERLILSVERAFERKMLKESLNIINVNQDTNTINNAFSSIITQSEKMINLFKYAEVLAKSGNPILITGETGTGKELFAKAIHKLYFQKEAPFVAVNMAAIPESLFESMFYGYKKGAFTGAIFDFTGYFEQANEGTLFLDEIGDLPYNLQSKLLRVLDEQTFTPLGDNKSIRTNVKILSATNQNIQDKCKRGEFRLDLFYRLANFQIHLPNLSERDEDISHLSKYFIEKFTKEYSLKTDIIKQSDLDDLKKIKFNGNIRELSSLIQKMLLTNSQAISNIDIFNISKVESKKIILDLKQNELKYINEVLNLMGNNKNKTAEVLGLSLRQLQRKLAEIRKNNS